MLYTCVERLHRRSDFGSLERYKVAIEVDERGMEAEQCRLQPAHWSLQPRA